MARIGKIARLSKNVREELNQRLADNEKAAVTLGWLNGLKDVQRLLAREFEGRAVNKQNLSEWRRGGFAEWELREDFWKHAPRRKQAGELITQESENLEPQLVDGLTKVVAGRLAELLARWDGEVTVEMERKLKWLRVVSQEVVRLQRGQLETEIKRYAQARREQEDEEAAEQAETDMLDGVRRQEGLVRMLKGILAKKGIKVGQDKAEKTQETQGDGEVAPPEAEAANDNEKAETEPDQGMPHEDGQTNAGAETQLETKN